MIYLACFLSSAFFAHLAYKAKDKKKIVFFSIVSILIPVLLAGLRDFSIGIDVENYHDFKYYWTGAYFAEDLYNYLKYYLSLGHKEILFALYLGFIDLFTNSFRVFVFLSHVIIMVGVYIGAYRQRHRVNPALVLLLFYFCFFHHSLNVIRQYMAMAIIFVFLKDLEDGKYLRYGTAVIVAMLIHTTAILGFGALLIHLVLYTKILNIDIPLKKRMQFIIFGLSALVILFKPLILILIRIGILGGKYAFYVNGSNIEYGGIVTIFLAMELVLIYLLRKDVKGKDEKFEFYLVNSISYFILYQLSAIVAYGKRIAIYLCLNNLVTLAFLGTTQSDKKRKFIVNMMIVGAAMLYWFYIFIYKGASETYPYMIFDKTFY